MVDSVYGWEKNSFIPDDELEETKDNWAFGQYKTSDLVEKEEIIENNLDSNWVTIIERNYPEDRYFWIKYESLRLIVLVKSYRIYSFIHYLYYLVSQYQDS